MTIDRRPFVAADNYSRLEFESGDNYTVSRVISQDKGLYHIANSMGEQPAHLSGKFRYNVKTPSDMPAVGDFVKTNCTEGGENAVIHAVLPRKSAFVRKAAGTVNTEQVVAANIDTVFICMALNKDFNLRRLERYLSVAWNSGARPVVVLTKADLCDDTEKYVNMTKLSAVGVDVVLISAARDNGYNEILPYLKKGETVALIGSSGVGKSTLINRLLGENLLDTNEIGNDDKGRHTTTRRSLFLLKQGAMVIDTPGMRELGMFDTDDGLDLAFSDIEALAQGCKFKNCSHITEPHCLVRDAIERGELSEQRFQSYQKLKAENKYMENSAAYLAEKKEKFKNISKINKKNRKHGEK